MSFRKPIKDDFVDHYPMAKPVELHDAHVVAYIMLELDWDSATVDPSLPQPPKDNSVWAEELWEA